MAIQDLMIQLALKMQNEVDESREVIPCIYQGKLYYIFEADEDMITIVSAASIMYGDDEHIYGDDDLETFEHGYDGSDEKMLTFIHQALRNPPMRFSFVKVFCANPENDDENLYVIGLH